KKILLDWGTLPCLAIQHDYSDGVITTSRSPQDAREVDITIYPNSVKYFEKTWKIPGNNDHATSRSFVFSFNGRNIILSIIEAIRTILFNNSVILYRLFESN